MQFTVPLAKPIAWEDRDKLPDCAGVYVIEKASEVIYIGAAWYDHSIKAQVQRFHQAATTGEGTHAGGIAYSERYGHDVSDLTVRLYLPYGVNQDEDALELYSTYIAQRMLWEHFEQFGKVPVCNAEI